MEFSSHWLACTLHEPTRLVSTKLRRDDLEDSTDSATHTAKAKTSPASSQVTVAQVHSDKQTDRQADSFVDLGVSQMEGNKTTTTTLLLES